MKKKNLLVIEDEASVAKQLKWALAETYDITIASDAKTGLNHLTSGIFPVATLDLGLPPCPDKPEMGFKLLEEIAERSLHTKIVVITGNAEQKHALKAVSLGAADFCEKPIDIDLLKIILDRTHRMYALEKANRELQAQAAATKTVPGMIGISPVMQPIFQLIRKVSTNSYPVLITGQSGTGKEVAAHTIHGLSQRAAKPFVVVNCGAIPENLIESELFGHEKGAFTGATDLKKGKFELADGGTLFLDEIGELPLGMQVKLLRSLQDGYIDRVGGSRTIHADVRIIAATNVNLELAVEQKRFREDLYFRLNVIHLALPPLKKRPEDIVVLAQHFLANEAKMLKLTRVSFSPMAIAALTAYDWPGNIRELQNRIRRALTVCNGQFVTAEDLELESASLNVRQSRIPTLKEARNKAEIACVRQALTRTGNNISKAAKLLGVSRPTIHDLIAKHKIPTTLSSSE